MFTRHISRKLREITTFNGTSAFRYRFCHACQGKLKDKIVCFCSHSRFKSSVTDENMILTVLSLSRCSRVLFAAVCSVQSVTSSSTTLCTAAPPALTHSTPIELCGNSSTHLDILKIMRRAAVRIFIWSARVCSAVKSITICMFPFLGLFVTAVYYNSGHKYKMGEFCFWNLET